MPQQQMTTRSTGLPMVDLMLNANRAYFDFWQRAFSMMPITGRQVTPFMSIRPVRIESERESEQNRSEQVIGVGEESLNVSTRRVTAGTTRVRRVVREVPVERRVELHDETIIIERRPGNGQSAGDDALAEREYVMIDTREIPVVNKETRLREQLVLRKETNNRVEVIRENVRQADVQVEQPERMPVVVAQQSNEVQEHHGQYREERHEEHHEQQVHRFDVKENKDRSQEEEHRGESPLPGAVGGSHDLPGEEHHEKRDENQQTY